MLQKGKDRAYYQSVVTFTERGDGNTELKLHNGLAGVRNQVAVMARGQPQEKPNHLGPWW